MNKNKTVLVFGTFDGLHPGHKNLFQQAKNLGDHLIAVIARDSTVKDLKGTSPQNSENIRLKQVLADTSVDEAYLGHEDDKYKIIKELQPDIIALGYDQYAFVDGLTSELKKLKIPVEIVRLKPFHPEKFKSSKLKNKLI